MTQTSFFLMTKHSLAAVKLSFLPNKLSFVATFAGQNERVHVVLHSDPV
jgi:hypothetical protein